MPRAIVFVPSDHFDPHADHCIEHCEERGYTLVAIVRDNWSAVVGMIAAKQAEIVVVSTETHLDPERLPRVEVVADQPACGRRISPWEQRTRIIRRNAAR